MQDPDSTALKEIDPDELVMPHFDHLTGMTEGGRVYSGNWRDRLVSVRLFTRERMEELKQLRAFKHRNIAKILGFCQSGPKCIVFDHCFRGSMADILRNGEYIAWNQCVKWARQIANGMHFLHRNRMIHRELNPVNLLVDEDCAVRITGYGFTERIWLSQNVPMTVAYIAPEVINGEQSTTKADIWSFGVVLWEMITRQRPYAGQAASTIASKIANNLFRLKIPPAAPKQLLMLLRRIWNYDKATRPEFFDIRDSIDDMYAALRISEQEWIELSRILSEETADSNFTEISADLTILGRNAEKMGWIETTNVVELLPDSAEAIKMDPVKDLCHTCYRIHPDSALYCCLFDAVENNDLHSVRAYLHADAASFLKERRRGYSPLMKAAAIGNVKIVSALLDAGASVTPCSGKAAIHIASGCGNLDIVSILLVNGTDKDMKDDDGSTPLQWAAKHGSLDVVHFLLECGADIKNVNKSGRAAIHFASGSGNENIVSMLLDNGVDEDLKDDDGCTPLHWAAKHGAVDVARLLHERGADLKLVNKCGKAAIHLASGSDSETIVALLLDNGVDKDLKDNDGCTPLHWAAKHGAVEVARVLCDRGADLKHLNKDNQAAIHIASAYNWSTLVEVLIDNGDSVNATGYMRWTPLHHAVVNGSSDTVKCLIENEADFSMVTESGESVFDLAKKFKHRNTEDMLTWLAGTKVNPRRDWRTAGQLRFPGSESSIPFKASDLESLGFIGRGNYGRVYEMLHKPTGTHMAVKDIRPLSEDARKVELELSTHARVERGPSLVSFFGYVFHAGSCLICMELMDVSLEQLSTEMATQQRMFTEKFIWMVAVDVLAGLWYLRNLEQMHRDIKPSNILLSLAGRVKLCDFGLSCSLGVNSMALSLTHVGCKQYMAPERISSFISDAGYGIASDIWSFGISLVKTVTGRFPYQETNEFQFYMDVVNGPAPLLMREDLGPDHSEEMQAFINICLEKDVTRRPGLLELRMHPFFYRYRNEPVKEIRAYVGTVVDELLKTIPAFNVPQYSRFVGEM